MFRCCGFVVGVRFSIYNKSTTDRSNGVLALSNASDFPFGPLDPQKTGKGGASVPGC